jgi:hypothetical protein
VARTAVKHNKYIAKAMLKYLVAAKVPILNEGTPGIPVIKGSVLNEDGAMINQDGTFFRRF